jgi:hypothetical protein
MRKEIEGAGQTHKKRSSTTWKRRAKGSISLNKLIKQKKK